MNRVRRSQRVALMAGLSAVLMGCTGASTEPTPVPIPTPGPVAATPDALVFSGVKGQASAVQDVSLNNPGSDPVQVTSLTVTGAGNFELVSPPALPFTLNAGASVSLQVRLSAGTTVGVVKSSLQTQGGTASVALSGLRAVGLEGSNEPPLSQIVDALGYTVNLGWAGLESDTTAFPLGSEIKERLFVKAGTGAVTLTPVARYSPDGATPFGYFTTTGTAAVRTAIGSMPVGQYQTLNPAGAASFDPGSAAFGVYIDPAAYNYPLTYTKDSLNTGRTAHAVRVYPVQDSAGAPLANTYVLCFEPSVNGDYQDAVFVLTNVKPASGS